MKRTLLTLGALGAVLSGPLVPGASAQDASDRSGTSSFNELLSPVTPRTVALGQTLSGGLNDLSGVEAVASNPGALTTTQGSSAMFSRMEYPADIGVNYLGIAQAFGANSIALTVTAWDYGDIFRTTEESPEIDPNNTWTGSTVVVGGTFARRFTDRISAGATLKGMNQTLDNASASAIAFDAGITYAIPESGVRFGVSLRNFGTAAKFSGTGLGVDVFQPGPIGENQVGTVVEASEGELPSLLSVGGSYTRQFEGNLAVTALASATSHSYTDAQFGGGLEASYDNLLYVRGGVNATTDTDREMWDVWNVGAGLNLPIGTARSIRVDYGYRPANFFGGSHLFSVGLSL